MEQIKKFNQFVNENLSGLDQMSIIQSIEYGVEESEAEATVRNKIEDMLGENTVIDVKMIDNNQMNIEEDGEISYDVYTLVSTDSLSDLGLKEDDFMAGNDGPEDWDSLPTIHLDDINV